MDSDSDSKDFPPSASTRIVYYEVTSSSSQSSNYEDGDSPPPSPTMPRWDCQTLDSADTVFGDPYDTQKNRSQHQDIPHPYIITTLYP
jgi:hypothetical protein